MLQAERETARETPRRTPAKPESGGAESNPLSEFLAELGARDAPGAELGVELGTDSRKKWVFYGNAFSYLQDNEGNTSFGVQAEWKPARKGCARAPPKRRKKSPV